MDFALNPALDSAALAETFRRCGRTRIADFLAGGADAALAAHVRTRDDWTLVINQGEKLFELGRAAQDALTEAKSKALDTAVFQGARDGFQFRYETIRVPDDDESRALAASPLANFARFMSSPEAVAFFREVTGEDDINFADAQATAYSPGHFLTCHDDDVENKHRRAAFVLSLSPDWNADWGGLTTFMRGDGSVEAWTPAIGTLALFRVPQPHSVSLVAPWAPRRRYAITGWLRAL